VARRDVDSDQPAGIVVRQDPAGGAQAASGSTVTLFVSNGSQAGAEVPDVTSQAEADAIATLENAGFEVSVVDEQTTDPNSEGIVLSQDPPGGTTAEAGETVTIFVGRLVPE
jgi:serine/threonine-protein kinase